MNGLRPSCPSYDEIVNLPMWASAYQLCGERSPIALSLKELAPHIQPHVACILVSNDVWRRMIADPTFVPHLDRWRPIAGYAGQLYGKRVYTDGGSECKLAASTLVLVSAGEPKFQIFKVQDQ